MIEAKLNSLQVPANLQSRLRRKMPGAASAILLYGSYARGDATSDSDLDVVAFDYSGRIPPEEGRVSISVRSLEGLLSASGTLFGYHLKRDGVVLFDPSGRLAEKLSQISAPQRGAVTAKVLNLSPVLDVSEDDFRDYGRGIVQVARYLLRSALYAEALDQGEPCYSVRELSTRKGDEELVGILSSRSQIPARDLRQHFSVLKFRLEQLVGTLKRNPYSDLQGLAEEAWEADLDLSNLATLAMSSGKVEIPYDQLPQVVL